MYNKKNAMRVFNSALIWRLQIASHSLASRVYANVYLICLVFLKLQQGDMQRLFNQF